MKLDYKTQIQLHIYIYDISDLVAFRDSVNAGNTYAGKTVYLMKDLDMSSVCSQTIGSWTPIGTGSRYFSGTFDGRFHIINNLYINSNEDYQALFAKASNGAIKNLILNNAEVAGRECVAGLVAYAENEEIERIGIGKDAVNEEFNIQAITSDSGTVGVGFGTGGIIGKAIDIKISECFNKVNVISNSTKNHYVNTGGIIGHGRGIDISNCYNTGNITSIGSTTKLSDDMGNRAGGIVGTSNALTQSTILL